MIVNMAISRNWEKKKPCWQIMMVCQKTWIWNCIYINPKPGPKPKPIYTYIYPGWPKENEPYKYQITIKILEWKWFGNGKGVIIDCLQRYFCTNDSSPSSMENVE
jgi:hypothetical protein